MNSYLCMKFGNLFLVHVGLRVDSALVAELLSERQVIKIRNGPKQNNGSNTDYIKALFWEMITFPSQSWVVYFIPLTHLETNCSSRKRIARGSRCVRSSFMNGSIHYVLSIYWQDVWNLNSFFFEGRSVSVYFLCNICNFQRIITFTLTVLFCFA